MQCLKSLYLHKNHPELKDRTSEVQQAIFNRGHDVGDLAHDLFPGGAMAAYELPAGFSASIKQTRELKISPVLPEFRDLQSGHSFV